MSVDTILCSRFVGAAKPELRSHDYIFATKYTVSIDTRHTMDIYMLTGALWKCAVWSKAASLPPAPPYDLLDQQFSADARMHRFGGAYK